MPIPFTDHVLEVRAKSALNIVRLRKMEEKKQQSYVQNKMFGQNFTDIHVGTK